MKINKKFLKTNKVPILVTTGVILAGLAGGSYYLASSQDKKFNDGTTNTDTTTDTKIPENTDQKTGDGTVSTTTPAPTTATTATTSLNDVSLSVLLNPDNKTQAFVSLYGPAATYGIEKLVSGSWSVVVGSFSYSGHGGSNLLDTITSASATTHYRVFKLVNGARTAVSGDTAISWQDILTNGTLTVPLAE